MVIVDFENMEGGYGAVAVKAVKLITSGSFKNPSYAWDESARGVLESKSTKEKGCPKGAFLGLCEEGFVKEVPCGNYTSSKDNKRYALKAVQLLKKNYQLSNNKQKLWDEVMKLEGKDIQHSGQMDVIIALWKKGLIDV